MLEEGTITAGQARPLIGLSSASRIAEEIVTKKLKYKRITLTLYPSLLARLK